MTAAELLSEDLDIISVEVRTVSGKLLGEVSALPKETAGSVKQRVLENADDELRGNAGRYRLVHDLTVLNDHTRLSECISQELAEEDCLQCLVLMMVCSAPSTMASWISSNPNQLPEVDQLTDPYLADSVFQFECAAAARSQPKASSVSAAISQDSRTQVITWLGMACGATRLEHGLLHGAVRTLDRYAASVAREITLPELQKLTLSSLCLEMKLANADDFPPGQWQRVLQHLSHGQECLSNILRTEHEMLRQLDFDVGTPTSLTFLDGLTMRLTSGPGEGYGPSTNAALRVASAQLLAELALYDPSFQYGFPAAIVAASALGVAFMTVVDEDGFNPQPIDQCMGELKAQHDALLDDLSSYCPGLLDRGVALRDAERKLLELLQECATCGRPGRLVEAFQLLVQRHARRATPEAYFTVICDDLARGLQLLSPKVGLEKYRALYAL